jgi:hypothetical protein
MVQGILDGKWWTTLNRLFIYVPNSVNEVP